MNPERATTPPLQTPSDSSKKRVAIATFLYQKELTRKQEISVTHLLHFLGGYDKYLVLPPYLQTLQSGGFGTKTFPSRYFKSRFTNSILLLRREFYEAFSDYEYLLIYELDALVFSDQLLDWCDKGYDFIGAPWIKSQMIRRYNYPDAVGNGGFSLRRVESYIRAIDAAKKPISQVYKEMALASLKKVKNVEGLGKCLKKIGKRCKKIWAQSASHRTLLQEDRYWAFEAPKRYPLKMPSVDEALAFSFEVGPRYCFERNHNTLPFGCHAWQKYDEQFWHPYLLKNLDLKIPFKLVDKRRA